jgi:hypothetical protein
VATIEVSEPEIDVVTKIVVKKVDFYTTTITNISCHEYERIFNSTIETYIIEDKDSIQSFMDIINQLREDNAPYRSRLEPDVRSKLLIYHQNGLMDTLCMDSGQIMMNERIYIYDERLRRMVEGL